ncbi:MAG: hypothetical protein ABIN97_08755 [Ginsengibacter sp.]
MSIINQLATSLNRRDEIPNQELAREIVQSKDKNAVKELVENLINKNKNIQADCIKVLYEIGLEQPALIKDYVTDFTELLSSKNNRLAWGGMMALNHITNENPETIFKLLPRLVDAANKGSVITRDNLVSILIKLEAHKKYSGKAFLLLLEQMTTCPPNQIAMYAQNAMPVVNTKNNASFIKTLQKRLPDIERETMKSRILKVIKKVSND